MVEYAEKVERAAGAAESRLIEIHALDDAKRFAERIPIEHTASDFDVEFERGVAP